MKLKVLASLKFFNQQESVVYCHYPQTLARKVIKALTSNRIAAQDQEFEEADSLLDGAVNQRKMVKILRALQDLALKTRDQIHLAVQHHRDRQVRVVLFALKKHQLITIMQKTIVQGRQDRLRERLFWEWRVAYARSVK